MHFLLIILIFMLGLQDRSFAQESAAPTILPGEGQPVAVLRDRYPQISRDGKTIVFDSSRAGEYRQIFTANIKGKKLRQLTFTNSNNRTPAFSPDGGKIVFQSARTGNPEIFVMNIDGSDQQQITHFGENAQASHPKWAYDGTRIIFDSTFADPGEDWDDVFEVDPNGENIVRRTQNPDWDTYSSISPDGSKILWRRVLPTGGDASSGRNSEIFIMDRDGENPYNISNHQSFDGYPGWAPDGSRVIFASNRGETGRISFNLYAANLDGSELQKLTATIENVEQVRPAWAYDDRKIIFNKDYPGDRIALAILPIERLKEGNIRVGRVIDLSPVRDVCPQWSEDGYRILFWSDRTGKSERFSVTNNVDAVGFRRETVAGKAGKSNCESKLENPVLSPDGSLAAFASDREAAGAADVNIFVRDADGANLVQVTKHSIPGVSAFRPIWSPDSNTILYSLSYPDGHIEMRTIRFRE